MFSAVMLVYNETPSSLLPCVPYPLFKHVPFLSHLPFWALTAILLSNFIIFSFNTWPMNKIILVFVFCFGQYYFTLYNDFHFCPQYCKLWDSYHFTVEHSPIGHKDNTCSLLVFQSMAILGSPFPGYYE